MVETAIIITTFSSVVAGFDGEQVSLCNEAMNMKSEQLKLTDTTRKRILEQWRSKGMAYTTQQWECLITRLEQREAYDKAMVTCIPE